MDNPPVEQNSKCDQLAKRIADLDPQWPKMGMACRTKSMLWRRSHIRGGIVFGGFPAWTEQHGGRALTDEDGVAGDALRKAIASGPDHTDDTTLGAILRSLGALTKIDPTYTPDGWRFSVAWTEDPGQPIWIRGPLATSPTEAILAAKVDQLEMRSNHPTP